MKKRKNRDVRLIILESLFSAAESREKLKHSLTGKSVIFLILLIHKMWIASGNWRLAVRA